MSDLFLDYDTAAVQDGDLPYSLSLELVVDDRDVIRALVEYPKAKNEINTRSKL